VKFEAGGGWLESDTSTSHFLYSRVRIGCVLHDGLARYHGSSGSLKEALANGPHDEALRRCGLSPDNAES
jgi:hypothetical protein